MKQLLIKKRSLISHLFWIVTKLRKIHIVFFFTKSMKKTPFDNNTKYLKRKVICVITNFLPLSPNLIITTEYHHKHGTKYQNRTFTTTKYLWNLWLLSVLQSPFDEDMYNSESSVITSLFNLCKDIKLICRKKCLAFCLK